MNKETDLKEIESMLSALYSGLLSAAPAVDAADRSKMIKNNKKNAVPVFRRPVVQFAAAICAALIVGVATYALLMKLNNRNDPVSPLTDNSADQTESGPDNDTTDVTVAITTDSAESPDTETQTGTETTADVTVAPETSDPETTAPETTVPETTVPETTAPETTAPETTVPVTTAPETTAPETTVPETTVPETTAPDDTTEPQPDDIMNYLEFEIIDPKEDESNLTISYFGKDKFARLIGIKECSFESVTIPSEYNGYPVKSVTGWYDDDLFMNIKGLVYVEFPDSVIYIEHTLRMFRGSTTLTEVRLPKYLKEIPEAIFYDCENLQKVVFPETVEQIDSEAFYKCKSLRIESVPGTVKEIGTAAFSECLRITEITLPQGLEFLGDRAFQYCSNLKKIKLPDTLWEIGSECFWSTSLKNVVIPENKDFYGLPSIGVSLFANCTMIESVRLPEGLSGITWQMFSGCYNLKELNIPESVTAIYTRAFANCGVETIRLGKNVDFIAENAFSEFKGKIEIDPDNPYFRIENGEIVRITEE